MCSKNSILEISLCKTCSKKSVRKSRKVCYENCPKEIIQNEYFRNHLMKVKMVI